MEGALKKGLVLLVVLFVGFYLFTDPHGLATVAKDGGAKAWGLLVVLFRAIIRFLNTLFA
ncbi:MAG: hypothetical protein M3Z50_12315 [Actinomycetota bacterium]|nr:hypothetical protein [Actinomycetota bacterium]